MWTSFGHFGTDVTDVTSDPIDRRGFEHPSIEPRPEPKNLGAVLSRDGSENFDFGEDLQLLEVVDFGKNQQVGGIFNGPKRNFMLQRYLDASFQLISKTRNLSAADNSDQLG